MKQLEGTAVTWRMYDYLRWVLPEADLETGVEANSFVWESPPGSSDKDVGT